MTNSWNDIKNTDLVLIMGGNAAEAHPCGFKWVTEAKANNGAKLIVVDPRFTRSAAVADVYAPIRPGTDIAFLSGVMRYLLGNNKIHQEYVKAYTNASYIVKEGYDFRDGLFTGYDESKKTYVDRSTWDYEPCSPATTNRRRTTSIARPGTTSSTTKAWPRSTTRCRTRAVPSISSRHMSIATRPRWWSASPARRRRSSCRSAT